MSGTSELNNAVSICVRLQHKGTSVLLCGDTIGRHIGDAADSLIATEKHMVDQKDVITIDSDILIAAHHGADNGSATAFIEAVSPSWVVFSAGSKYEHPRQTTVDRYMACGVPEVNMLRTDLGDKQRPDEWPRKHTTDGDSAGDDDVDILIRADGAFQVEYRDPHNNTIWQQP